MVPLPERSHAPVDVMNENPLSQPTLSLSPGVSYETPVHVPSSYVRRRGACLHLEIQEGNLDRGGRRAQQPLRHLRLHRHLC